MMVAGIGCRPSAAASAIVAVVRAAEGQAGGRADLLAAPAFRDGAALREAAARLGLTLRLVDRAALLAVQPRCESRSAAALAATGLASVAEAAALAAAGVTAVLRCRRLDGDGASCALAQAQAGSP